MAKKKLSEEIRRQLDDEWLNLNPNTPIINPFERLKTEDPEEFYKRLTCLFLNPDYIYFVCKHVLNVELLPMQALILQEMWQRKFPMLVATRGFGKTWMTSLYCLLRALLMPGRKIVVVGAAFRQSKFLHEYMSNIWKNAPVLRDMCSADSGPRASVDMCRMIVGASTVTSIPVGDGCLSPDALTTYENRFGTIIDSKDNIGRIWGNGKFRDVDYFIDNGVKPTKKITTKKGFEFECTHNHAMKVIRDGNIQWCRSDQMIIGDRILIDASIRWHNGTNGVTKEEAYNLGLSSSSIPEEMMGCSREIFSEFFKGFRDSKEWGEKILCDKKTAHILQYILLHYGVVSTIVNSGLRVDSDEWQQSRFCGFYIDEIGSIEDSESYTCDIHVPEDNEYCANGCFSHNSKIRGLRANDIVADEFGSHSREIFENVIAGFAAVSANPVENVKNFARQRAADRLGIDLNEYDERATVDTSNQIILSGTAYYDFNHFAEYWKKWRSIILTGGDEKLLSTNVFNGEPVPESFNWKDYSIIRIPVDLAPRKFMDEGQVARSKATVHNGIYLMEFAACFTTDSQGFFKRSLIESCVGTDSKPIHIGDESIYFDPLLKGNKNRKYVMAVDPASEVDNFSIIILELHGTHRRIVHCWTTTRSDHTEKVAKGITKVNNFYSYCARKIRDLMKLFNVVHIAMDSQGGGYSVSEALHDLTQLEHGEIPIWPIIDPEKEAPTDDQSGLHILEMCQFANYEWYSEANHGLRKDLENKTVLFPRFDPITIGLSIEEDSANNRLYDTLEDCVMEIEELKNELSMIEITQSVNGRERWDTPETKVGVSKKRRLRKDRYSALIMANLSARKIDIDAKPSEYHSYGGFSSRSEGKKQEGATYEGPNWFTSKVNNLY